MTAKEMNNVIQEYCETCDDNGCERCCIKGICDIVGGNFERNTKELVEAYDTIVNLKKSNNVNHPAHYQGKHECIDEMIALFGVEAVKAFCKCNVYKYRFRAANKNGQEDLDKADWYMDKLMELEGEKHD